MPQGDKRGNGWEFFDATYDGHWDGELRRGLGQLTDGRTGPDNDRTQGWVGWRNDTRGQPVEIKFEFDKVREFSAIHIYCNNQFTKDVQVSVWRFVVYRLEANRQVSILKYLIVPVRVYVFVDLLRTWPIIPRNNKIPRHFTQYPKRYIQKLKVSHIQTDVYRTWKPMDTINILNIFSFLYVSTYF